MAGRPVISHCSGYHWSAWSPTVYNWIWPLLLRGWVFREPLLCSKAVYFGQERLLWECCEGIVDEYYGELTTMPGGWSHFYRLMTRLVAGLRGATEDMQGGFLSGRRAAAST